MNNTSATSLLVRINNLAPDPLVSTFSNIELNWDQSFVQAPSDPTITAKPYPQDGTTNQFVGDTYLESAGVDDWEWSSEVSGPITGQLDIKFIPNTKKPNKVVDKKIDLTINLS
jgi:hypothetical protein